MALPEDEVYRSAVPVVAMVESTAEVLAAVQVAWAVWKVRMVAVLVVKKGAVGVARMVAVPVAT